MTSEWYPVRMTLLNYNREMISIHRYKCEKLNTFIYHVNIFEMPPFVLGFVHDTVAGFNYSMSEKR